MRRSRIPKRIALSIMSSLVLVLFLDLPGQAQVQDIVVNPNGSFEEFPVTVSGDTSGLEGWTFELGGNAGARFAVIDSVVKDGNRALAITVDSLGPDDWSIQAVNEPYQVNPEYSYTLSLWARASSAGATASFTVGNPAFNEFGRIGNADVSLDTEWQEFTLNFTVPAGNDTARTPLHFNFSDNVGKTIYIDSVRVTRPKVFGKPAVVEAEAGSLGGEWETATDTENGATYVTITSDYNETTGAADRPGEGRTITYQVTFPDTGNYDLFARVYVGPDGFDDDSWFIGSGFGEKSPDTPDGWTLSNGLASAGFNAPDAVVRTDPGGLGSEVWKWVNFTKNGYQGAPADTFRVDNADSSYTFEIGARENGLRIDKLVFGLSDYYYTVATLNNGEAGTPNPPQEDTTGTMEPIAAGKDKFLGNIYSPAQVEGFTSYWNQVTPENAGKWGSVEGTRDQMNWSALDNAYNLAVDNGYPFRYHVLVWGAQQPGWIDTLSQEEQLAEIREWFEAVADRYGAGIDYLEVVNEGSNGHNLPDGSGGNADYIDALGGSGETGHDWIITAFQMARDIFPPSAQLMINDYGIVGNTNATSNYLDIIEDLQERDLIDAIGVQSHAFSTGGPASGMRTTLNMLGETGLPVQATEMDIDGDPNGTREESDQVQLEEYQRVFPVFWQHPAVEGVTLWGWRTGLWRQDQEANLVRNNGEPRPALEWLQAYVDTAETPVSVKDQFAGTPRTFRIYDNYPNPFNPTTQIKYEVPRASEVSIKVYDIAGRLVHTLVDGQKTPGIYTVPFDAQNLASGVYFYRLQTESFSQVKRMILIK